MKNLIIWAILLGAIGYFGTKMYLHHKVGKSVDMTVSMISPWVQVEYDGISSTMSGELTIDGVTAYVTGFSDEIYIESIGIDTPSFLSLLELGNITSGMQSGAPEIPEHFGFIAKGVHVPVRADYFERAYKFTMEAAGVSQEPDSAELCAGKYGFSPKALAGLGYREQVISMSMILRQKHEAYAMEISADIKDMWAVDAVLTLAGDMTSELMKGTAYRPKLSHMQVDYQDNSLKQRVVDYCGELGLDAEQTLTAQLDAFNYLGESNGIVFDEYMIDPYKTFLESKSRLLVTARPSEPISMSHITLYAPEDVPALLNLEAVAQ